MLQHEDNFLAVLEKIGQVTPTQVTAGEPAVLDATTVVTTDDRGEQLAPGDDSSVPPPPAMVGEAADKRATPVTRKNLFVHYDVHPVVYDIALLRQYDVDWLSWEPDTLWKSIKEDFHVPSISDHAKTKIQAVRTLHIMQTFWTNWEVFCWINQALNNNIPDWQVIQKPSLAQLFNSVDISAMIRSGETFVQELQSFVAASFLEEGVLYAPPPLDFCQDEIIEYLEDRHIDYSIELLTNVEQKFKQLSLMAEDEWNLLPGELVLDETPVDVQVAKLKVAWDYLTLRRRQLKEQLQLLS